MSIASQVLNFFQLSSAVAIQLTKCSDRSATNTRVGVFKQRKDRIEPPWLCSPSNRANSKSSHIGRLCSQRFLKSASDRIGL